MSRLRLIFLRLVCLVRGHDRSGPVIWSYTDMLLWRKCRSCMRWFRP